MTKQISIAIDNHLYDEIKKTAANHGKKMAPWLKNIIDEELNRERILETNIDKLKTVNDRHILRQQLILSLLDSIKNNNRVSIKEALSIIKATTEPGDWYHVFNDNLYFHFDIDDDSDREQFEQRFLL